MLLKRGIDRLQRNLNIPPAIGAAFFVGPPGDAFQQGDQHEFSRQGEGTSRRAREAVGRIEALADAQLTKDNAYAAAEHDYTDALAAAGKDQGYAYAAADEAYTNATAAAAVDQVAAEASAGNALAKSTADAQRTLDSVYSDTQVTYVSDITSAALTWATTVTSARGEQVVAQFAAPDNTPEQDQRLANETAVADAWADYQMAVVQARVDRVIAETAAHAVRSNAEADAWKDRTYAVADAAEDHDNQVAAEGASWAADAAAAERDMAEGSADAHEQWMGDSADAEKQYAEAEAAAYKVLSYRDAEAAHRHADKLADAEYNSQSTYWLEHMADFYRRADASEIRLIQEMQAQAEEAHDKALGDAKRAQNEAQSRADRFKKAGLRDKEIAVQSIKTGMKDSIAKAHRKIEGLTNKPAEYFETQVLTWGTIVNWVQNHAVDWLYNDGLDMATDFFVGAANGLTLGYFTTVVDWATEGQLLAHVHQDSWSYFAGNFAGLAVSFIISGAGTGGAIAGHVGWAYFVAKGYAYTTTLVGTGESIFHVFQGNATWSDALNLIPLGGAFAGHVTRGFGIFKCFVGDTPVVVGYENVTTQVTTSDIAGDESSGQLYGWCGVCCLMVGAGGAWLLRNRREEDAERQRLFAEADLFGVDDEDGIDPIEPDDEPLPPRLDAQELDDICDQLFHGEGAAAIENEPATATLTAPAATLIKEKPMSQVKPTPETKPAPPNKRRQRKILPAAWLSAWMVIAGLFFWQGNAAAPKPAASPSLAASPSMSERQPVTRPIQEIRLGQRTIGRNPLRHDVHDNPDPDPATWRAVQLQMHRPGGGQLDIELLRPLDWIESVGAEQGATIDLDLHEFGASGPAAVVSVEPSPEIATGDGNVITGRFIHQSTGNLIRLHLHGQAKPTGVTDNHLYWSVDRREFVPAGNLRIGETLNTSRGATTVARIERVTNDAPVYNLEVNNEHVYRVGELGTLVHNAYALHHLFPRALGSDIAYGSSDLTRLGMSAHRKLHKALNKHLKKYTTTDSAGNVVDMMPRRGNPGSMVRRNFTSDERKNAVQDFYDGYKNGKYLQDFLTELTKTNVW